MKNFNVRLQNGTAMGYEISFPNANLVVALAKKGYVMCGYLNMATANKVSDVAAIVRGVKTVDDLLQAQVQEVSGPAAKMGIKPGMTGKEALEKMMDTGGLNG